MEAPLVLTMELTDLLDIQSILDRSNNDVGVREENGLSIMYAEKMTTSLQTVLSMYY